MTMTEADAITAAKKRWGHQAFATVTTTSVHRVGARAVDGHFTIYGEGHNWEAAFHEADRHQAHPSRSEEPERRDDGVNLMEVVSIAETIETVLESPSVPDPLPDTSGGGFDGGGASGGF
jgi:hypothetical protein